MAFDDAFLMVGIFLLIGAVLVWFCEKTKAKESGGTLITGPHNLVPVNHLFFGPLFA
jgi:hypothetical protein